MLACQVGNENYIRLKVENDSQVSSMNDNCNFEKRVNKLLSAM